MGNQQSNDAAVIPPAPKKKSGGSAFQCLAGLDSTGEAQLKKQVASKAPLDVAILFQKYKIEEVKNDLRSQVKHMTNRVIVKQILSEIIDQKMTDYIGAMHLPQSQPIREKLRAEASEMTEHIELLEAVFDMLTSNCKEKYSGHDSDYNYNYSYPIQNESNASYKPVVLKQSNFKSLIKIKIPMDSSSVAKATPRFGEDQIVKQIMQTPQSVPQSGNVSICEDNLFELPNTPKRAYKIRQWETISGPPVQSETLEKESFRTTAPSQTQSSRFTMPNSLRCHTYRNDNSQIETENHDGTIAIMKRRKKKFQYLTPTPGKQASKGLGLLDTKPQFDDILRALHKEEMKRKKLEKINPWDWNA